MLDKLELKRGTLLYRIVKWFVDNINWCEGYYYDEYEYRNGEEIPKEKPENKLYLWVYTHFLWPWKQTGCVCCNTVRGMIYVVIINIVLWSLL